LDFNPQFAEFDFARIEEFSWEWKPGMRSVAGLYYPVGYTPEKRYPLVIQTHGWTKDRFQIEGFSTSGYGAQALAHNGFFVLQVDDISGFFDRVPERQEIENALQMYSSAISLLAERGMVDPHRVGILGFSRTTAFVTWALVLKPNLFAAAASVESTGGYISYMSRSGVGGFSALKLYGGPPFGTNLGRWIRDLPAFNLDRVRTPIRLCVLSLYNLLSDWDWYEGLRRRDKPVDLVMLNGATHTVTKPRDRMVVSGGNVDWFAFWLNGYEDPASDKAAQYTRWRELRQQHYEGLKQPVPPLLEWSATPR